MAVVAMCFAVLVVVVVAGTLIRHNTCFILAIAAGVFLLAGAGALVFGRRLAIYRERNGYVREEDLEFGGPENIEGLDFRSSDSA